MSPTSAYILSRRRFDAVVFDLDGVVTRTARVHAAAWKEMFDDFLDQRGENGQCHPFDIETDYKQYVDGKPRYEGVRSFLQSRGIELPEGEPDDPPRRDTVCGLGNRKNQLFRKRLKRQRPEIYDTTVDLIHRLRRAGFKLAVVSSSRNCKAVLESAGLNDLFDARVDGNDLQRLNLGGKPAPDMFEEAARRLDESPERCVGIEDAIAGVESAHRAGFGRVIGVKRNGIRQHYFDHGADQVVADLGELRLSDNGGDGPSQPPSALQHVDTILAPGDTLALFLDYDGTLTPIVAHPDRAVLSEAMRETVRQMARLATVAVVSGRDLPDVRQKVAIDTLWYAGSHGFDIAGPGGQHQQYQQGTEYLTVLDHAEQRLHDELDAIPGCLVERKRFSIANHFRQVANSQVDTVKQRVRGIASEFPQLRLSEGKKILELQPDIDWDKGKAVHWLLTALDIDSDATRVLYIGDDVTDEDAFAALASDDIGILVSEQPRETAANYRLNDPAEVQDFLRQLIHRLKE